MRFIKMVGSGPDPLIQRWQDDPSSKVEEYVDYPARAGAKSTGPNVHEGDKALLYAAVWQSFFAWVELTSDPYLVDPNSALYNPLYPWRTNHRLICCAPDLASAPSINRVFSTPKRQRVVCRRSHLFALSPEELLRASGIFVVV